MSSTPGLKLRNEILEDAIQSYKKKEEAWKDIKHNMLAAHVEDVEKFQGEVNKVEAEKTELEGKKRGLEAELFLERSAKEEAVAKLKKLEEKEVLFHQQLHEASAKSAMLEKKSAGLEKQVKKMGEFEEFDLDMRDLDADLYEELKEHFKKYRHSRRKASRPST